MKITYISHSGFAIELEKTVLLFDYFKGVLPDFAKEKTIYVFASHKHPDHFNPQIFELTKKYANIRFFLSRDIRIDAYKKIKYGISDQLFDKIIFLDSNKEYAYHFEGCMAENLQPISVRTLKSTDEGVAFAVTCENENIYHAGDLNWWHWNGETKGYNRNMEVNYKREMNFLRDMKIPFSVAFLPLDSRLEDAYGFGMRYFMEQISVDVIFPMHLWEDYACIDRFKEENQDLKVEKIISLKKDNMQFMI